MNRFGRSLILAGVLLGAVGALAAPAAAETNLGTVSGLTYIQGNPVGPAPTPSVLSVQANCPGTTHLVGGGATSSSTGSPGPNQFWINRSRPFDGPDADTKPDDGWLAQGYNRLGTNKSFVAYAICLAAPVTYATASASATAHHGMVAQASCPAGTHVGGGGAAVNGAATASYLNASHPFDSGDPGTQPDDGWRARAYNVSGTQKSLKVYADCVSQNPQYATVSTTGTDPLLFSSCPSGTHGMGGGELPSGTPSQAFLNTLYPYAGTMNPPDTGFVAIVHTTGPALMLTNYVVCKT